MIDRESVFDSVRAFYASQEQRTIVPGETYIPVTGKILDESDLVSLIDASLDMWLTSGRFADRLEKRFAEYFGIKWSRLTNSGSSANLLAFASLTSPLLKEKRIKAGDEVITVAAGFPTTVAPIVQCGCIPVFVDVDLSTHNVTVESVEAAITPKTRAIMIAHNLGNPYDAQSISELAKAKGLFLIEDSCDALGATLHGKPVGTFGDLATLSFYPAHHITMGEGGLVFGQNSFLLRSVESFRDWGRDCWCKPGVDNTCKKRFGWTLGDLPQGYDHKYTYSHLGYNLKLTDMQAALGLSQMDKLSGFVEKRRSNHQYLCEKAKQAGLEEFFHLPEATPHSNPSWFGFLLTLRDGGLLSRNKIVQSLEAAKVGTRLLFGGNLTRQPAFKDVRYRISGALSVTDKIMMDSFWIGVWPGLDKRHLDYMIDMLHRITRDA